MTLGPQRPEPTHITHWRQTRRFTLQLLLVWFFVTFIVVFFARELSRFTVFGWPFSFYMAAQGTTLIYLIIVGCYAWRMQRFDRIRTSGKGGDSDVQ